MVAGGEWRAHAAHTPFSSQKARRAKLSSLAYLALFMWEFWSRSMGQHMCTARCSLSTSVEATPHRRRHANSSSTSTILTQCSASTEWAAASSAAAESVVLRPAPARATSVPSPTASAVPTAGCVDMGSVLAHGVGEGDALVPVGPT